jgi:hypothetical protein
MENAMDKEILIFWGISVIIVLVVSGLYSWHIHKKDK